jgi:hypothetical protein
LSNLDIYREGLKTWTDLLDYISSHSSGRINPRDLNALADAILTGTDKSIAIIKEKILAYGENYKDGDLIRQSVTTTDQGGIKIKEQWLRSFYNESLRRGLTARELNKMLIAISSLPGTDSEKYLRDLIEQSEEPITGSLKSLNLDRENIKSPEELINFLISNTDKEKYPEDSVFKSIANLIIANNIPDDILSGLFRGGRWGFGSKTMISAISALAGIILLLFFIIWRRKRKDKQE